MSYTNVLYHIILATKHRRRTITSKHEAVIYRSLLNAFKRMDSYVLAMNGACDHVHVLCSIPPRRAVARVIAFAKGETLKLDINPRVKWADGFSVFTVNPKDFATLERYIRDQKRRHSFHGQKR